MLILMMKVVGNHLNYLQASEILDNLNVKKMVFNAYFSYNTRVYFRK